jgi:hypothetical protein
VTYIMVIAALLREVASRESGCIFALVFAGGNALSMLCRLPRVLRHTEQAPPGTITVAGMGV